MRLWIFAGCILLIYSVETTLFSSLPLWGVRPDLNLIFVCAIALSKGWRTGSLAGFAAGFIADLADGHLIGLGAVSKAIAGGGVGWAGQNLFGENVIVPVLVVLGASLMEHTVYLVGLWSFGFQYPFAGSLVRIILPSGMYDALAGMLFYPLFKLIVRHYFVTGNERGVGSSEA